MIDRKDDHELGYLLINLLSASLNVIVYILHYRFCNGQKYQLLVMEKIYQVIEKNNISKLRVLLSLDDQPENVADGWTPLTFACERGREEIVDILIKDIKKQVSLH